MLKREKSVDGGKWEKLSAAEPAEPQPKQEGPRMTRIFTDKNKTE